MPPHGGAVTLAGREPGAPSRVLGAVEMPAGPHTAAEEVTSVLASFFAPFARHTAFGNVRRTAREVGGSTGVSSGDLSRSRVAPMPLRLSRLPTKGKIPSRNHIIQGENRPSLCLDERWQTCGRNQQRAGCERGRLLARCGAESSPDSSMAARFGNPVSRPRIRIRIRIRLEPATPLGSTEPTNRCE